MMGHTALQQRKEAVDAAGVRPSSTPMQPSSTQYSEHERYRDAAQAAEQQRLIAAPILYMIMTLTTIFSMAAVLFQQGCATVGPAKQ